MKEYNLMWQPFPHLRPVNDGPIVFGEYQAYDLFALM